MYVDISHGSGNTLLRGEEIPVILGSLKNVKLLYPLGGNHSTVCIGIGFITDELKGLAFLPNACVHLCFLLNPVTIIHIGLCYVLIDHL